MQLMRITGPSSLHQTITNFGNIYISEQKENGFLYLAWVKAHILVAAKAKFFIWLLFCGKVKTFECLHALNLGHQTYVFSME